MLFANPKTFSVHKMLVSGLGRYEQKLHRVNLESILDGLFAWREQRMKEIYLRAKQIPRHAKKRWLQEVQSRFLDPSDPASGDARDLFAYLCMCVERELKALEDLKRLNADFRRSLAHVSSEQEHRQLTLKYAGDLGAKRKKLRGDARAFRRWFDDEAVNDRFLRRRGDSEQRLVLLLQRLGTVTARVVSHAKDESATKKEWNRLGIERLVHASLDYEGDVRVHVAALKCLSQALTAHPKTVSSLVTKLTITRMNELARNRRGDVWVQSEALAVLAMVSPAAENLVNERLSKYEQGDDFFFRKRAVLILGKKLADWPAQIDLFPTIAADSSEYVRQQFAHTVWQAPVAVAGDWINRLAREDRTYQVRATALLESLEALEREELHLTFLQTLKDVLASEEDEFVSRVAIHVSIHWLERYLQLRPETTGDHAATDQTTVAESSNEIVDFYLQQLLPVLRDRQSKDESIQLRRSAAEANHSISCLLDPKTRRVLKVLRTRLDGLPAGRSRIIPRHVLRDFDQDTIGRVFAVLAQTDFGFDIERCIRGYRITRGPMFGFRVWRFLFEIFRSATDKRQSHVHTVGRFSYATLRAPSAILGELSETKVPGEPFTIAVEGNWRPYLPLADDFVSILNLSWLFPRTVKLYTSQGVTEVTGPRGFLTRLRANYRLTRDFAVYARLRNWDEKAASTPEAYIEAMQKLGFEIRFRDHGAAKEQDPVTDQTVLRFFPCLLAVSIIDPSVYETFAQLLQDYADYFGSAFENSLTHLLVFVIALICLFFGRHFYANWTLRRARLQIALCIGGWGTRGKSGTERLKAAFLARLGHSMVSKSTGCEAMFLHNHKHGDLLEIPFFRPYDKATIWEQRDIVRIAAGLNASVFLWECMGLTPSYVNILQRQWMNDDLSTITNTYPDHEDLQGPAGYDVAQTIAEFVPGRGHLFTTEQQMRPILADACRVARTSMCGIGWLESGLITDDIMDRFPYQEHPDNIALVLAIADELNCERDFALKAMADDMVPDLGVLKTYPLAHVNTRKLEFTNGMSANERFGCLGNWSRLSFDQLDENADTWVSTVVNNRADRVARSRVFSSILVNDISADRHFIIGSNLKGLQGFISEDWDAYVCGVTLWPDDANDKTTPEAHFKKLAIRFRQPIEAEFIQKTLKTMLDAVSEELPDGATPFETEKLIESWSDSERVAADLKSSGLEESLVQAFLTHLERLQTAWREYSEFLQRIPEAKSDRQKTELNDELRKLLRVWFDRKIVVIEDYEATGEQIIHTICEETPPGYRNRIMGLQNIKGTGLDFVYRWLAWDACRSACQLLTSSDVLTAEHALETLSATPVFGQLCDKYLRDTFEQVSNSPIAQGEKFQLEKGGIIAKLERTMAGIQKAGSTTSKKRNRSKEAWDWLVTVMEEFVDINDAVRRRKRADEIYRDLTDERIGRHRAVDELRILNKRQKGAWLAAAIAKRTKRRVERKSLNRRVKTRAPRPDRRRRPKEFR